MSLWDSISSGLSSATDWLGGSGGKALSTVANIAGAGYDLYQGIQNSKLADKYANMSFSTAEAQNRYAQEMFDRYKNTYWPIEDKQNALTEKQLDLALSPEMWTSYANANKTAGDLQARQSQFALDQFFTLEPYLREQAKVYANEGWHNLLRRQQMYDTYDQTERSLIRKLTEGEDVLRDRMMSRASTDVKSSYADASSNLDRQLGLAGISTSSPQAWAARTEMAQSQALAEAAARTNAANTAEDTTMNRWAQALNYNKGLNLSTANYTPSTAISTASGLSGSGGNYGAQAMSGYSAASGSYSNMANMYNNMAQNNMTGFGGLLKLLTTGSEE